jgi:iron(III) transport system substrate-binding protein
MLPAAILIVAAAATWAHAKELNLYSSRHYQTDEALYEGFTQATGIKINRIEAKEDALIERIRSEGQNSPADVLLTVDAGRLWQADQAGLFQPVRSDVLERAIPAGLRHPDGHWFGFSQRARVIVYNRKTVDPAGLRTYEDLADPRWKNQVCIRSSSNIYNLSLMSALIAAHGEQAAEAWARGVVANFARPPQGGDTDQIRAVAAGACGVALVNTYYYVRLMTSDKAADREVVEATGVIFPNQADRGTHANISGAGVLKHAPNRDAAVRFLEYLVSGQAQRYFADGNNEYPVIENEDPSPALKSLGSWKRDPVNVAVYGENQAAAQRVFDRAGWK